MRLKSSMTGNPLEISTLSGTTVQPERTPCEPMPNLEEVALIAKMQAATIGALLERQKEYLAVAGVDSESVNSNVIFLLPEDVKCHIVLHQYKSHLPFTPVPLLKRFRPIAIS
ncbi:hypothetical protein D5086_026519 [Populus alba]|uniref:Uncharacterized protein n=1 Tax=Populus alba TaxID=43335 RepID=A0ACC4B289_POPAL